MRVINDFMIAVYCLGCQRFMLVECFVYSCGILRQLSFCLCSGIFTPHIECLGHATLHISPIGPLACYVADALAKSSKGKKKIEYPTPDRH